MKFSFDMPDFEELAWCSLCITLPVVSAVGGIASAAIGAGAAKDAAQTQADAANQASANTMKMYQQTREDLAPYRDLGAAATPNYLALLGAGPNGAAGMLDALQKTPGYQFTQQQGLQAVQNSMAAQGLGVSGAAMKGAANYATGLAQGTYQNILGNYYSALNMGENAAAQTGQLGANYQGQSNQLTSAGAAASAAGTVGAANAITGGINTAMGGVSNAFMLSAMGGGGSGGFYGGNFMSGLGGTWS